MILSHPGSRSQRRSFIFSWKSLCAASLRRTNRAGCMLAGRRWPDQHAPSGNRTTYLQSSKVTERNHSGARRGPKIMELVLPSECDSARIRCFSEDFRRCAVGRKEKPPRSNLLTRGFEMDWRQLHRPKAFCPRCRPTIAPLGMTRLPRLREGSINAAVLRPILAWTHHRGRCRCWLASVPPSRRHDILYV